MACDYCKFAPVAKPDKGGMQGGNATDHTLKKTQSGVVFLEFDRGPLTLLKNKPVS